MTHHENTQVAWDEATCYKDLAFIKRDIDRGFRRFCVRRGIDPHDESMRAQVNTSALAAVASKEAEAKRKMRRASQRK